MRLRGLFFGLLLSLPLLILAQTKEDIRINAGIKAGFQAVTYNDPEFKIDGYVFDYNNIQSNKIGYVISPFARQTAYRGRYKLFCGIADRF